MLLAWQRKDNEQSREQGDVINNQKPFTFTVVHHCIKVMNGSYAVAAQLKAVGAEAQPICSEMSRNKSLGDNLLCGTCIERNETSKYSL